MACGIYAITHRASGKKYVGQSINIDKRIYMHSRGNTEHLISRAVQKYGFDAFDVEVLEECSRDLLGRREQYWIAHLACLTPNGYNLTTGGEQPIFSEQTIQKLRIRQQNRSPEHIANKNAAARRPETIKKISAAMKGRQVSEETREKLRDAFKGRVFKPETIKAMSEAAKKRNPDFVARMVSLHKGKKLTDDHKAKLSVALKNPSEETRSKLSAAATGRKHSAETIKKMKEARNTNEWRDMCASGAKGKKQTPEQIEKRVAATAATKLAKKLAKPLTER